MIQWVLKTPKTKEFRYIKKRKVLRDTLIPVGHPKNLGKLPLVLQAETEIEELVVDYVLAGVVKITSCINEVNNQRLFVRFVYGREQPDGSFQTPFLDDGIIFSGNSYLEHGFHNDVPEEQILLNKIAALLKWDGCIKVSEK